MFTAKWKIKGMSKKNWNNKASIDSIDIVNAVSAFEKFPEQLEQMAISQVAEWQVKALFENTLAKIKDPIHSRVSDYRIIYILFRCFDIISFMLLKHFSTLSFTKT